MDGSVETGNQTTPNGTADNNAAGTSLENIMGSMAEKQPNAEPGKTGENAEGSRDGQEKTAELPAWTSQLSDELRNNADVMKQLTKFGKISDLAKGYSELEGKLGKAIVKPGKDASEEELNNFYKQLGKPASADQYSINEEGSQAYKELAYKYNLSDDQATGFWEAFKEIGKNAIAQQQAQMAATAKATDDALRAEYGQNYDAKIKMLQRGVNTYGGPALGKKLQATGLLFDPDVVKMFIGLGEMSAEAGTVAKTAAGEKDYKSIAEGGQFSFVKNLK